MVYGKKGKKKKKKRVCSLVNGSGETGLLLLSKVMPAWPIRDLDGFS
jgi:hypothetical protein